MLAVNWALVISWRLQLGSHIVGHSQSSVDDGERPLIEPFQLIRPIYTPDKGE